MGKSEHQGAHVEHATTILQATLETGFQKLQEALAPVASNLGVRDRGAEPRHMSLSATGTLMTAVPNRLMGWMLRETTGIAPATVTLYDGDSTDGSILGVINLAAGESVRDWFGPNGIALASGLFVTTSPAGAVRGPLMLLPGT